MHGTRAAAQDWQYAVRQALSGLGFAPGASSANMIYHPSRCIWCFVHGDDSVSSADPRELEGISRELSKVFLCKTQILGPERTHVKEVRVPNRLLTWDPSVGFICEADPRHVAIILKETGVDVENTLSAPGTKATQLAACKRQGVETEAQKAAAVHKAKTQGSVGGKLARHDRGELLGAEMARRYKSRIAIANCPVPARVDLAFTVKELGRRMAAPTQTDWEHPCRIARNLAGKPRRQM